MSVIISDKASNIEFLYSTGDKVLIDKHPLNIKESGLIRKYVYITNAEGFVNTPDNEVIKLHYSEVTSPVVASNQELIELLLGYKASTGITIGDVRVTDGTDIMLVNADGSINTQGALAPNPGAEVGNVGIVDADGNRLLIEDNGSMPVTLQDQSTPVVMVPVTRLEQATTLNIDAVYGDRTITVNDSTGIVAGKWVTLFSPTDVRYSMFKVITTNANIITLDSPLDFAYPLGSYVDVGDSNLGVDGSSTPILFGVRNNAGAPAGIDLTLDITRLMFTCRTDDPVDLGKFADIAGGITNGLLVRKRNGETYNIFNVKTNAGLAGIMYDWSVQTTTNPSQGQNGFLGRLTFAGQSKMGVVVRLPIGDDLEVLVQDDLSTIDDFGIIAEGSIVEP